MCKIEKQNSFTGFLLIALGVYFLLQQTNIEILEPFYTWPSILIIVGLSLVFHCYVHKDFDNLFAATLILGMGIHFHGLMHYDFWINHWAIYPLIIGISLIIRFLRTKKGLIPGVILIAFAVLMIFSVQMPEWFDLFYIGLDYMETFWPIILIISGFYFMKKKRKIE